MTEITQSSAPTWDLSPIFPGKSDSPEFVDFKKQVKSDLTSLEAEAPQLPETITSSTAPAWSDFVLKLQRVSEQLHRAHAFVHCLVSQDVDDTDAQKNEADIQTANARYQNIMTAFESLAAKQTDDAWEILFEIDEMKPLRFFLDEKRNIARDKLPAEQESLINDLAVDGYHAWNRLYEKLSGDLRAEFTDEKGETKTLSFGQISNQLGNPNRDIRRQAFETVNEMWRPALQTAATGLNSLAGFRLSVYQRRNWSSFLKEPLLLCRTKQETLDAMWQAVSRNVSRLKPFIEAKKRLLGLERFMWFDQSAPVGKSDETFTFADAAGFIVENLRSFSPEMADFSQMALDQRWVEAEDRPGKRAGGYCTNFGDIRESRIFMTYSENYNGLRVLAHELGHAWHSWALRENAYYASRYTLNVAEAASTFNELLVADAALDQADDTETKLMLLNQKLNNALAFMCNIHARYIFECSFYERRRAGVVGVDELSELMLDAQRQAFGDLLDPDGLHELFWATKLHFFLTYAPFYNFPYTYGYLFSNGIYARAKAEGTAFAEDYKRLLQDTGRRETEELAQEYLDVDLTTEDFWQSALDRILLDVDKFTEPAR